MIHNNFLKRFIIDWRTNHQYETPDCLQITLFFISVSASLITNSINRSLFFSCNVQTCLKKEFIHLPLLILAKKWIFSDKRFLESMNIKIVGWAHVISSKCEHNTIVLVINSNFSKKNKISFSCSAKMLKLVSEDKIKLLNVPTISYKF